MSDRRYGLRTQFTEAKEGPLGLRKWTRKMHRGVGGECGGDMGVLHRESSTGFKVLMAFKSQDFRDVPREGSQ